MTGRTQRLALARSGRSTKAAQRAEMIEQILDAAERLFSRHGLHAYSRRCGAPCPEDLIDEGKGTIVWLDEKKSSSKCSFN